MKKVNYDGLECYLLPGCGSLPIEEIEPMLNHIIDQHGKNLTEVELSLEINKVVMKTRNRGTHEFIDDWFTASISMSKWLHNKYRRMSK